MRTLFKLSLLLALAAPVCLMARTTDFGAAELSKEANKIKDFIFGPPLRIAGIFGGAFGLLQTIMTSTVRPLLLYGSIGLFANFMPTFIDNVFVSGMLLP